ncbi:patatin-like phospholipase family protein [Dyella ginsengisoli]|uniref:patatin-like phospholipase family protein n=1 Tax=Dyella ginsengisoli TaxID=363848 RepID=UPI0003473B1F|nr:patatin-like phospholipase family protein [Dyella ginsengisoli]
MSRAPADLLLEHPLFGRLDATTRRALGAAMVRLGLPGGRPLFKAGEPADALYLVASGSLGVFDGPTHLVRQLGAGMSVGEASLLGDGRRHRTVRALRDSELLRLDRPTFEALLHRHPDLLLQLARETVARMQPRVREEQTTDSPRTFALVAADAGVPARTLAMQLARELEALGSAVVLDAQQGRDRSADWFAEREARARFVIYLDESKDPAWRRRCLRQADVLLPAARANDPARPWPDLAHPAAARHRPRHLLLIHPGHRVALGSAARWRAVFSGELMHHHVCRAADMTRVARLVSGHGRGLVLAGGGARGLAHLGALRALAEAGHRFDAIGGSSIGAIVGAGIAAGWNIDEWQSRCVNAFLRGRLLSDWTVPLVALTRGARATRTLRGTFGALAIEDLPVPFFATATSLSGAGPRVLRQGPLWLALRASSAIPGVLPPVLQDGEVLVDGALANNLPTDVMAADGLAHITALDIRAEITLRAGVDEAVTPPWWRVLLERDRRPGLVSSLVRAGMVSGEAAALERRALAHRLVTPSLDHVGVLDWKDWRRAVEAGYRATVEVLESEK